MTLRHLYKAAVATAGISVPTLFEAALGRLSVEDCDQRLERWSRQLLEQAQIGLEVEGLSALPADENFVVMSNHQSLYDIPVIFQALHRRVRCGATPCALLVSWKWTATTMQELSTA